MKPRTLWAVAAAVAGVVLVWLALPDVGKALHGYPWDGKVDWIAATAWWKGIDPYSAAELHRVKLDGLGHPPTTSFYALPLALFSMQTMSLVLGDVVILLLCLQLLLLAFELRVPAAPATALLVLGVLLCAPFMQYHLGLAQVSELIGFLYFVGWLALRRGREATAGAAFGVACAFKLFPGLMVVFLLLTRRFRGVAAAVGAYLAIAALMTSRFGVAAWREYFQSESTIANYWLGHPSNASVQGILLRVLYRACRGARYSDPRTTALAAVVSVVLFVLLWRLSRAAWRRRELVDLPFSLFALLSLFTNPFFFEHYNILLVIPYSVAAVALWRAWKAGLPSWRALAGVAVLVAVPLLISAPPNNARGALGLYYAHQAPHLYVHLCEVAGWLSAPLLLILCGSLLFWFERRGFRGLQPLHCEAITTEYGARANVAS